MGAFTNAFCYNQYLQIQTRDHLSHFCHHLSVFINSKSRLKIFMELIFMQMSNQFELTLSELNSLRNLDRYKCDHHLHHVL